MSNISLSTFLENGYSKLCTQGPSSFKKQDLSFLLITLFATSVLEKNPFSISKNQLKSALTFKGRLIHTQEVLQGNSDGCVEKILGKPFRIWSTENPRALANEMRKLSYAILKNPFQDSQIIEFPNESLIKECETWQIKGAKILYSQLSTPSMIQDEEKVVLHRLLFFHMPIPGIIWFKVVQVWLDEKEERYSKYGELLKLIPDQLRNLLPFEDGCQRELPPPLPCFQDYVIDCTLVSIEKKLSSQFVDEIRKDLAKQMQDESVRIDLLYYFINGVDIEKYRHRISFPIMKRFEIYNSFSKCCEFPRFEDLIKRIIYYCDYEDAEKLLKPNRSYGNINRVVTRFLSLIHPFSGSYTFELLIFFLEHQKELEHFDFPFVGWDNRIILTYLKRADLKLISKFKASRKYSFDTVCKFSQQTRGFLSVFEEETWFNKSVKALSDFKHASVHKLSNEATLSRLLSYPCPNEKPTLL